MRQGSSFSGNGWICIGGVCQSRDTTASVVLRVRGRSRAGIDQISVHQQSYLNLIRQKAFYGHRERERGGGGGEEERQADRIVDTIDPSLKGNRTEDTNGPTTNKMWT